MLQSQTFTWLATLQVVERLGEVSGEDIGISMVPALVLAVLLYFDHNVSGMAAQQPEFNLVKPSTFSYDFALLSCKRA